MTALAQWTLDQVFAQLNSKTKWTGDITFAYPTQASQFNGSDKELAGFQPVSAIQQPSHNLAFETWADLILPKLTQSTGATANIHVGYTDTGIEYAHALFPSVGDIWYNKTETTGNNNLQTTPVGSYGFATLIHEIGHAIGLDHMGDYNGNEGKGASSYQDSTVFSVMSYYGPSSANGGDGQVQWGNWIGSDGVAYSSNTPMLNDIYAIQRIYGASTTTRSDDTIYGFNSNIQGDESSIYNFSINKHPILAIYDAGGRNTIDLSGYLTDSNIDLKSGGISSINGMTNNLQIAYNTIIQKFIGGSGVDTVTANDVADIISTNLGNDQITGLGADDIIDGGAGIDTSVYRGARANYTVTTNGNSYTVSDNIANRDGVDTLTNIERVQFVDGALIYDIAKTADAALIYRLYQASFARSPDEGGFRFWIEQHDKGLSTANMATSFIGSTEFGQKYGSNISNAKYVDQLYQNVLGRAGESGGVSFWNSKLDTGALTKEAVLVGFSGSSENVSKTAANIDNGYWLV